MFWSNIEENSQSCHRAFDCSGPSRGELRLAPLELDGVETLIADITEPGQMFNVMTSYADWDEMESRVTSALSMPFVKIKYCSAKFWKLPFIADAKCWSSMTATDNKPIGFRKDRCLSEQPDRHKSETGPQMMLPLKSLDHVDKALSKVDGDFKE